MRSIENTEALYPEIIGTSLGELLKLRLASSEMNIEAFEEWGGSRFWATADQGYRKAQLVLEAEEREIFASLFHTGVKLAFARSDSFDLVAEILIHWIDSESNASDLASKFQCVTASPSVESYEEGPHSYVRFVWEKLASTSLSDSDQNAEVITLASTHPILSLLLPYQSHNKLLFSKCTGYPYSSDSPAIFRSNDIGYTVEGGGCEFNGLSIAEALEKVVELLPKDYTKAMHGTAKGRQIT